MVRLVAVEVKMYSKRPGLESADMGHDVIGRLSTDYTSEQKKSTAKVLEMDGQRSVRHSTSNVNRF
jgi:hypothetical protein